VGEKSIIEESINNLKNPLKNGTDLWIYDCILKAAYGFDWIPHMNIDIDFMLCSNTVRYVGTIANELEDYFKKTDGTSLIDHMELCFSWCIFAGIGISYFYHRNDKTMDSDFLLKSVIEPRGCFSLDEFVLEEIISKEGLDSEEVSKQILAASEMAMLALTGHTKPNEAATQLLFICRACFIFGTSFEMILIEKM